jgi:methylated-DNA-protein-cysteine methyltransferase related protein
MSPTYERIYAVVRQIPYGQVATYGQVAELAGLIGKPRLVGYALYRVDGSPDDVPWHRVINAKGEVSHSPVRNGSDYVQQALLEDEGIEFSPAGKIDLGRYRWQPSQAQLEQAAVWAEAEQIAKI